jgi:hypothetical protein
MAVRRNTTIKLSKALVLNRWVLSHFGVDALESLAEAEFRRSVYEVLDENNRTRFHNYLENRQHTFPKVSKSQLLAWDQNIVSHTLAISAKRTETVRWKYFQYLSLLFTELYLEKYFHDREGLLKELNDYVERFNDPLDRRVRNESDFVCEPFTLAETNKIAFWSATGSGKTLLMHVNILQYRHYLQLHGRQQQMNKVLLVTPNEGLSQQHLKEFAVSGMDAELFSKRSGSMFGGERVEVLEITKLAEESGEKTTAVEHFGTNNLVLVDEGHRGVAGEQWKTRRDELSLTGFAFEYSATFGQAVSAANGAVRSSLLQEYSKSILIDYSYRYFHTDGYGKDYHILNLPTNEREEQMRKYLTGALLVYYQQSRVFSENPNWAASFNIEKPLWVFVGGSVNAVRTVSGRETSDVLDIVKFFKQFIQEPMLAKQHLQELLSGNDGLVDGKSNRVFSGFFNYLNSANVTADAIYEDILKKVFNADVSGADIYIDRLKGQDGELGIRVGNGSYFGVVNVGDEGKLFKLCQTNGVKGDEKDFSSSLFHGINEKDSPINLLIGSKKFSEGWSSWRVSVMGLMNIGRSEGSQIIQLFGRGVRLKGYRTSLKRSTELDQEERPETPIPKGLKALEILNIFGIRADYMQQFKEFLEAEGLPSNDSKFVTVEVPTMLHTELSIAKLKVLKLRDNVDFKKEQTIDLRYTEDLGRGGVKLEWYPKLQVLQDERNRAQSILPTTFINNLTEKHLAFVNWDEVFIQLQHFKNERAWYNISIDRAVLPDIMQRSDWHELHIPEGELSFNRFERVQEWQQVTVALLKGYVDRFYNITKSNYLSRFMETVELDGSHPNFQEQYFIEIEQSRDEIVHRLEKVKDFFASQPESEEEQVVERDFTVFRFLRHLYEPLIYIDQRRFADVVRISPVALNKGEYDFVKHLKYFYVSKPEFFTDTKLYLLRNRSRQGIGFFEANGFYPDFILWLVKDGHQYITFIDPKGLRNVNGLDNPKLRFHITVKERIEAEIRKTDPNVTLNSFIVSPTSYQDVRHWRDQNGIVDFNNRHVYFMGDQDQRDSYVEAILTSILKQESIDNKI